MKVTTVLKLQHIEFYLYAPLQNKGVASKTTVALPTWGG